MFRPMRRASRAIPEEAAKHLLQQSRRGVLAVNGDNGYPFAIPVNYYYDQEHDKIYFHGAKSGQKVDALKQNDKVCFTVYGNEHFEPGDWAPYVQSTVVFGRCHLIDDAAATEARVRELGMKYYPGKEEVEKEIALDIKAVQLYEITIEHLTGKQIHKFQDLICLLDGGCSLGNDKHSHSLCLLMNGMTKSRICGKVKGRSTVIHDQDLRISHQCSCYGKTLALSAGKIGAALTYHGI